MYRNADARIRRSSYLIFTLIILAISVFGISQTTAQEDFPLRSGAYKLEMILTSTTKVPFFGTSKSASRSISLVEIKQQGNSFTQTHKVCDFRLLEDSLLIKMIFPEKFVAALANHLYPISVAKDSQGWTYRADLGVERIGYRTTDDKDILPAKPEDPSVFDWDNDGHPAATLKISVPLLPDGQLFIVQRGQSILTGRIVQPGQVEGSIEVRHFQQRVIGAWPKFLNQSPEITPEPKESRFTLTQVRDSATCESLRKLQDNGAGS